MIFCVQSVMPASFTVPQLPVSVETHQHPGFPTSAPLHCIYCVPQLWDPRKDLLSITRTFRYLDTSGWYWGAVSAGEARAVLQDTPEGTFLVRDSSHPLYMLTLSVKTGRGPTNVRIEYSHGQFRLDSSALARPRLQTFPDVPSLVQHYVRSNRAEEVDGPAQESTPTPAPPTPTPMENALLLKLIRPLHRRPACPSLQHLARLAINRLTPCPQQLPLPRPLLDYLHQYPFQV